MFNLFTVCRTRDSTKRGALARAIYSRCAELLLSPQVYASWIAVTTVATNWVVLALSTSLGGAGTSCDPQAVNSTSTEVQAANSTSTEERVVACSPEYLFVVLGATTAAVVLSVAVFLGSIKRGHVGSFYRPRSYKHQCALNFPTNTYQEQVQLITARDPVYWPTEAVRAFIAAHWVEWEADPPAWFADPRWKAALPEECWPDKAKRDAFFAFEIDHPNF